MLKHLGCEKYFFSISINLKSRERLKFLFLLIFNLINVDIKNIEYFFRIYEITIANHHKNNC